MAITAARSLRSGSRAHRGRSAPGSWPSSALRPREEHPLDPPTRIHAGAPGSSHGPPTPDPLREVSDSRSSGCTIRAGTGKRGAWDTSRTESASSAVTRPRAVAFARRKSAGGRQPRPPPVREPSAGPRALRAWAGWRSSAGSPARSRRSPTRCPPCPCSCPRRRPACARGSRRSCSCRCCCCCAAGWRR